MWDVLAIAPTDDPKAIRRAYAARLKQIDPDRERETFARLRQALEWALACARQPPRSGSTRPEPRRDPVPLRPHDDVHAFSGADESAAAPRLGSQIPVDHSGDRGLIIDLESALRRGDARTAVQLYMRAAATGALPLGRSERMLARLFTVALGDPAFDGSAFRDLAKSLGWDRPELDSDLVSAVRQRVTGRLAAEDWYDALVATANGARWWRGRRKSRIARLLLRRMRGWGLLRVDREALQVTLDSLNPHAIWLRDRIPPEWVATLERRMRRRELFANGAAIFILSFIAADAVIALIAGSSGWTKDDSALAIVGLSAIAALLVVVVRAAAKHFIGMWRSRR